VSSVTVNGFALRQADVAHMLARIAVVPDLDSVQLLSSTVIKLGHKEVVQFSLVAAVKQSKGAGA